MNKHIVTSLLLIFSTLMSAQKIKRKKEKNSNGTIEYYVLKSDETILHGEYKEIGFYPKTIFVSGNYSYGEKNGLWTEKSRLFNIIKNQGHYNLGKRVGIWRFYDFNGSLLQEYDYDNNILIQSKEYDSEKQFEAYIDNELVWTKLSIPPSYFGGAFFMGNELYLKFILNFIGKKNDVFFINNTFSILIKKDGTIGNIKTTDSKVNTDLKTFLEKEFNNNQWEGKFLPAELNGKKVDAYLIIQLNGIIRF